MTTRRIILVAAVLVGWLSPALAGPLHDAARDGDIARLQELIVAGEDVNARGNGKWKLNMTTMMMNSIGRTGRTT